MPIQRKQLANTLREARTAQGWSQAGLAERVKLSTETISRIEREAFEPSLSTLFDISRALGISLDELVSGDSRMAGLRPDERAWLKLFEQLPPPGRQALMTLGQMALKGRGR
jgi:putative transcriptional regulator